MGFPWEVWAPGALNKPQMNELLDEGYITFSGKEPKLGHSSMDLSLANEGWEMAKGSVKPSKESYPWFITKSGLATKLPPPTNDDGSYELKRRKTYVFRLQEKIEAKLRNEKVIYGQATAKSSVGRVDVLARLIANGMTTYECFDPLGLLDGSGEMFLEITPITFNVRVKPGTSLSQLRLFYGRPEDAIVRSTELYRTIFRDPEHRDESLTVNLADAIVGNPKATPCSGVAFRSKDLGDDGISVPLWKQQEKPHPSAYWDVEAADDLRRLFVKPEIFYILRSKEKLYVPKGIAIYCRASDETIGEMRIHYAGFVHPYFGLYREDKQQGTPLIFEVRGHQVPVSLADGEKMANLIFYRMSEDAPVLSPEEQEEEAKGYGSQDLKLSTFFNDWPDKIKRHGDGSVEAY
jgi:dCTP deaminase